MKIRKIKKTDYRQIFKINNVFALGRGIKDERLSPEELKLMFQNNRNKYSDSRVIELTDGNLAGFIFTLFGCSQLKKKFLDQNLIKNGLYLYCIAVDPKYQRQGYGKILWQEVLKVAKEHNKKEIFLQVGRKNKVAYNWYSNMKLKKIDEHVFMKKKLIK